MVEILGTMNDQYVCSPELELIGNYIYALSFNTPSIAQFKKPMTDASCTC